MKNRSKVLSPLVGPSTICVKELSHIASMYLVVKSG